MLKLNKDSKIAKVEVFAQGDHSSAVAYGEIYLPYELYELTKEVVDNYTTVVYELDGRYSETRSLETVVEELTLGELINQDEFNEFVVDLSDSIEDELPELIGEYLDDSELDANLIDLSVLSHKIYMLKREFEESAKGKLTKDVRVESVDVNGLIQNVIIPAGTTVELEDKGNINYNVELPITN